MRNDLFKENRDSSLDKSYRKLPFLEEVGVGSFEYHTKTGDVISVENLNLKITKFSTQNGKEIEEEIEIEDYDIASAIIDALEYYNRL